MGCQGPWTLEENHTSSHQATTTYPLDNICHQGPIHKTPHGENVRQAMRSESNVTVLMSSGIRGGKTNAGKIKAVFFPKLCSYTVHSLKVSDDAQMLNIISDDRWSLSWTPH